MGTQRWESEVVWWPEGESYVLMGGRAMVDDASDLLIESGEQFPLVSAEGRRFERYQFRALATATIHPPAGRSGERPQVCYVLTRDLSRGGISILHPTRLAQHQQIELELSDGRKFTLGVQWVKRLDRNSYCIGCRFVAVNKN